MKTLFVAYRVTDLDRSLGFYTALGYVELGRVEVGDGTRLVILKFPGEPAASLELVHRPANARIDVGSGFDHLARRGGIPHPQVLTITPRRMPPGSRSSPAQLTGRALGRQPDTCVCCLVGRRSCDYPSRPGGTGVVQARTCSVRAVTCSGGVVLAMPCPRLNTNAPRLRARRMRSVSA
jgi:lactoylglutathione lyase